MQRHRRYSRGRKSASVSERTMMNWKYPLSVTTIGPEEEAACADVIRSGWLSMGPKTMDFEKAFATMVGCRHALAVANGTAALHLALLAVGVGTDRADEVIQPAINFVAAANVTVAMSGRPVFADIISLEEPTVAPAEVERFITGKTKAVVVMHYGGYPARMGELVSLCRDRKIALIEDAAHAIGYGVEEEGRMLGCIGDIGCFSFFPNKNMTTGEGGMITTDRDDLAERVRLLRSHGMTMLTWARHRGHAHTYDVVTHGLNYRLDEIRAAIGLEQLRKLDAANRRRRRLAALYAERIRGLDIDGLSYVFGSRASNGAAHLAAITVPAEKREYVREALKGKGIQSSLHYPLISAFTAFTGKYGGPELTPVASKFADMVVTLPMYPDLHEDAVAEITDAVALGFR
jgi:dTDP-4-amino-4,6-dideoxygalactose transaminase